MKERGVISKDKEYKETDKLIQNAATNQPTVKVCSNPDEQKVTDRQPKTLIDSDGPSEAKNVCEALALVQQGPSLFSVGASLTPTDLDLASDQVGRTVGSYTIGCENDLDIIDIKVIIL